MKKKHIGLVSISLGKGGAEKSAANLSLLYAEKGFLVDHIILNSQIDYPYAGSIFNLGENKIGKDNFWQRIKRFYAFYKQLKSAQFDVIIDHRTKQNSLVELLYALVYKLTKAKIIYVVHNSDLKQYFTAFPFLMTKIYNRNYLTIGVSKQLVEDLKLIYKIRNTQLIYNPIVVNEHATKKQDPLLQTKTYFLYYGRLLNEQKDLKFLMTAFDTSQLHEKNIYLVLLGDGPDKKMLQDYAKTLACQQHILILPFTKTIEPYILNALAVLMTSRYEGFPMTLMEAIKLKKPVVALNFNHGPAEIINHTKNGYLVNKRDPKLFAEYLVKVCQLPQGFEFDANKKLFDSQAWIDLVAED